MATTQGVMRLVMRAARVLVALLLLVACGGGGQEAAAEDVSVTIVSPSDGATVAAGTPVDLEIELEGGSVEGAPEQEGVVGHLHVFVDGRITSMPDELSPQVTLEPGEHTITVEFVDHEHVSLPNEPKDEVTVTAE